MLLIGHQIFKMTTAFVLHMYTDLDIRKAANQVLNWFFQGFEGHWHIDSESYRMDV